jgi:hypothetical protein
MCFSAPFAFMRFKRFPSLLALALMLAAGAISTLSAETVAAAKPKETLEDVQKAWEVSKAAVIAAGQKRVADALRDPDSARFKDVSFGQSPQIGFVVCGWVNSKNAYGGYSGFQRFICTEKGTYLEENDVNGDFSKAWRSIKRVD